jgi:sugar phosphate isomerase/epimerase
VTTSGSPSSSSGHSSYSGGTGAQSRRIQPTLHGSQLRGGKLTLEEKAALAQKHGYPGLDFGLAEAHAYAQSAGGDPGSVGALLGRFGVRPSTCTGVFEARLIDSTDEELAAALEKVPENAREAASYGAIRTGTVLPGRSDLPKEEQWARVAERLRRLDAALDGTGVRLGVEFIGVKTLRPEKPHAFVQSMADANRLLDDAGVRNIGLTLDSYHWYAGEDTLETIRQTPAERIVILHLNDAKDVPRDQLIDQDRVLPGEGVIPLGDWLRAIDDTGFEGFIALEVLGPRLADQDPETCARLGRQAMDHVFGAAGL